MPVNTKKTVGQKLSKIADNQGENPNSISEQTDLSRTTIRDIFNGRVDNPTWGNVVTLSEFLGVDLDELKE